MKISINWYYEFIVWMKNCVDSDQMKPADPDLYCLLRRAVVYICFKSALIIIILKMISFNSSHNNPQGS